MRFPPTTSASSARHHRDCRAATRRTVTGVGEIPGVFDSDGFFELALGCERLQLVGVPIENVETAFRDAHPERPVEALRWLDRPREAPGGTARRLVTGDEGGEPTGFFRQFRCRKSLAHRTRGHGGVRGLVPDHPQQVGAEPGQLTEGRVRLAQAREGAGEQQPRAEAFRPRTPGRSAPHGVPRAGLRPRSGRP